LQLGGIEKPDYVNCITFLIVSCDVVHYPQAIKIIWSISILFIYQICFLYEFFVKSIVFSENTEFH